jgi:hypothetical protein
VARNRSPLFPLSIVNFRIFQHRLFIFLVRGGARGGTIEPVFRRLIVACPSDPLPSKSSVGCRRRRCSTRPLPSSIVKGTHRPRFRRSTQRSTPFFQRSHSPFGYQVQCSDFGRHAPRLTSLAVSSPSVGLSPVVCRSIGRSVTRRSVCHPSSVTRRSVCHPSVRPSPVVKCRERDSFSTIFPSRGIAIPKKVQ